MAQAILSVRMDENLKKTFDSLCNEFGMNTTTAITVFAKAVVQQRKIPFEIGIPEDMEKLSLFWSESNQKHLRKAVADINAGKYTVHDLIGADDD
jgi:DNA-damage-inducible protein J